MKREKKTTNQERGISNMKKHIHHRPKQKVLTLALTAALAVMAQAATAQTTISSAITTGQTWTSSDFTINSGASVSVSAGTAISASGSSLGTLSNSGLISGGTSYVGLLNSGTISAFNNAVGGTISGDKGLDNDGGTITALTNNSIISGVLDGFKNDGTTGTLTNNYGGTISGTGTDSAGLYNGGTIGGTITMLTNGGVITGTGVGVNNLGTITTLNNSGTISGSGTGSDGLNNGGSITTLINSGTISGGTGIYNRASIGTLINSGTVSSAAFGIDNNGGTITTLNNSGIISGGNTGIYNGGTIGTLSNSGTISGSNHGIGNFDGGSITTLNNSGTISGTVFGIYNYGGAITTLNNSGIISGGYTGIYNSGTIGTLSNSGTISGSNNGGDGITNFGSITTLTNSGIISGSTGIYNDYGGSIGSLNNSGLITGSVYALYNGTSGTLGLVTNAGTIAGNIFNGSSSDLSIDGGTGSTFGTLTGYTSGSIGTITNTSSNVVFGSGNLLLNDTINVGSNAVNNTGTAVLQVNQAVTITGNYNQGAGATLQIGVASGATPLGTLTDTGYGRLVVTGNSTIASGSTVTLQSNGYAFAAGQRYVVVDTAGTAVYNPGSLNYSINGYTSSVTGATVANGSNSDLVLNVVSATLISTSTSTPTPKVSPTTSNASNAIGGLLGYTGVGSPQLLNLYNAMIALEANGTAAAVTRAGTQLAPISQASVAQAATAPTTSVLNVVSGHLDSLRLADNDGLGGASGATSSGVSTGDSAPANGAWGQVFGGHASQSERDQVDGYNANFGGLMVGVDRALSDTWRVGGVFSYSNSLIDNTGDTSGDSTRLNSYGLMGYGGYTANRWYANISGGIVAQHYDSTRGIDFSGFSGQANGSFSGMQYVIRSEAGMPLAVGPLTVTPLAALTYSYLHQNGYVESGGDGAGLAVGAAHSTSVKSDLGARFARQFTTSYGVLVPELTVAWRHEYDNTRVSTAASYAADPTGETSFTTVGPSPESNLADLSLGLTLLRANNLSVTARYEMEAAHGYLAQVGTLKLRQVF